MDEIALTQLSKSYGRVHAVRSIDLVIEPGETVALLGPNGAGKSTTIDMLLGLTRPDSGSVSVFGMTPSKAVAAGVVGGMLQTGSFMQHLTVRELLTMVASLYPNPLEVDEVIRLSGISEFAGRRSNKLSGGQTQRVRFAVALIANPDLLVLDEPTVALDVEGRRAFWASMRAVAEQGKPIIFATHYLEEADDFADRVVLMARGRIVADGFLLANHGALFAIIKLLPSYWLVQAGKTALGHGSWPPEGWIGMAVWTAVLFPLTVRVYQRDTSRV